MSGLISGLAGRLASASTPGAGLVGFDGGTLAGFIKSKADIAVDSLAAISALPVALYTRAMAKGSVTAGDSGGGSFHYDEISSATVDGATVLSAAGGVGRWIADDTGPTINVKRFGVKGDGSTADLVNMQKVLTRGGNYYAPAGNYVLPGTLNWAVNDTSIVGAGRDKAIFNFTSAASAGMASGSAGTSQLMNCRLADIQLLDNGGLGRILDLTDMMLCTIDRCWAYGNGGAGSIGVYLGSTNSTLQSTYNELRNLYVGNVQYGEYLHDGANANTVIGGRIQSSVASAIGVLLAPSGYALVNGNSIISIGIETPGNTLTGIQLNGNTDGTSIIAPRLEALLNGIVISASDTNVAIVNPSYSGCSSNLVDGSSGKAFVGGAGALGRPHATFNYDGTTSSTNVAKNCTITRATTGQYQISGLPFGSTNFVPVVSSSSMIFDVTIVNDTTVNVFTYNSSFVAVDAHIYGAFWG